MTLDFMLKKYRELCCTIQSLSIEIMTLAQFLKVGQPQRPIVVLRHDVDRSLDSATRMAELEAEIGIKSTYYFRAKPNVFQPIALKYINHLGHEVGYHYEVLTKARGNSQRAIVLFEQELSQFRKVVPIETISMHGSPLLPWDNRHLWHHFNFKDYNLLGEAYLSIDYREVYYFTDTGRSWSAGRYNIRDRIESRQPSNAIHNTNELINFLKSRPDGPVLINTHPNRWSSNVWAWGISLTSDLVSNQAKLTIRWPYNLLGYTNE